MHTRLESLTSHAERSLPLGPLDPLRSLATHDSADLLAGARRIAIQHRGETYFLTETRANKLILTK